MQRLKINFKEAMARPLQDIRDPQMRKKLHAQIIADIQKDIQEAEEIRVQRIREMEKPASQWIIR